MKIALPQVKLVGWRRTAAYAAFFVVAFLVALRLTFPVEAVKERIILDAAGQGFQVKMNDISPSGLVGVRAREMSVLTASGTRIPIEELTVNLRLLPTLIGHRAVSFDASLYDGRISGTTDESKTSQRYKVRVEGVDLSRAAAVQQATGLELAGKIDGSADVTLDPKDPTKSAGNVDLQIQGAAIRGGKVPIPGMEGGLTVPPVRIGTVSAKGAVKNGRADFGTLEAKGDELEITADQVFVQLQPKLEYSPLNGRARVRPLDAFWRKEQVSALRPIIEAALSSAKGRDGSYGFQVYGTVGKPQARPMAF